MDCKAMMDLNNADVLKFLHRFLDNVEKDKLKNNR
jgi:hypothetical protein